MADNLNIKNPSLLPGDLDLRTDEQGYITSISGHPIAGGGGGGGMTYYGDDEYIQYKNGTVNTFTVTDKVKDVVDDFAGNVSVLIDAQTYNKSSIDTMVSAKQDKLVFSGYENKIETINGSGFIVNGYVTTEAYQIDKINYNKKINDLSASVSSKQDQLIFEYDEYNKLSAINGSALAGEGGTTYQAGTDLKIDNNVISVDTNGNPHNDTNTHNFVEGSWTEASGYNCHAEGIATTAYGYAVHAQGMWTKFSSSKWSDSTHDPTDIYWADGAGATVEGYCNATTSCPMSGTEGESDYGPVHGGIIKVIGNGHIEHDQQPDPGAHTHTFYPSDALIIFRDGTISAFGDIYKNDKKFITEGNFAQGNAYAMTTTGWEAIQAGGQGIQQVLHDDTLDGDGAAATSLLRVDTTKIQTVSGMTAYATTALLDNVSGELKGMIPDTSDMATKTWVEGKHYLISDDISSKADKTQLDDYLTITQYQTDSATFVTSSNASISAAGEKYALTTIGWSKIDAGQSLDAGSGISIDSDKINVKLGNNLKFTSSNNTTITTIDDISSKSFNAINTENIYSKIYSGGFHHYDKNSVGTTDVSLTNGGLEDTLTDSTRNISANYTLNHLFFKSSAANAYSQIEMKVFADNAHKSQIILTDFDGTATNTGLIDVTRIAAWDAAAGGSFGGVTTDDTLTGIGTDASHLGVAWSALSSNTIDYSNSAFNLTNGTSVSSFDQISAAIDDRYSKSSSDERYVTTANVGTGLYYSGSSPKLGVKLGTDLAFDSNGNIQVNVGGTNIVDSSHYAFIMGVDHTASGQGAFAGGYGTHTSGVGNFIHGTYLSFDCGANYDQVSNTPVFVGGTLNATTAQNYNINGGYLQIIGNGTYTAGGQGNRSDAYYLFRDGTVSAKQFQNADGSETINGTTYTFSGVDNIEILPNAATASTANFPDDNVIRIILEA